MKTQMTDNVEYSKGESPSRSHLIPGTIIAAAAKVWQRAVLFRRGANRIHLGRAKALALALMMSCGVWAAHAAPVICTLNPPSATTGSDVTLYIGVDSSIVNSTPVVEWNGTTSYTGTLIPGITTNINIFFSGPCSASV
jgi:hypothetical protein